MGHDPSRPANDDATNTPPSVELSRRGFARRMAELAGGAAFAALPGGNARASAAQRGAPVAHTYCVPGEALAVLHHPGVLTGEQVAQGLRAHPLLSDALFAGAAPDAERMITLASGADAWTLAALPTGEQHVANWRDLSGTPAGAEYFL